MGLFKTGLHHAARPQVRELPKSTPPKPPPPPPPPAHLANTYTQDTFTPEGPRRVRSGESAPDSYSSPISASQAGQNSGAGTGVLTLNIANGAGDAYRDGDTRERQADLIRDTGASIVAFQEADVNAARSGDVNTPLDVARRTNSAFDVFSGSNPQVPEVDINEPAPATAIRKGSDGTTLYQTPDATLITGESYSGEDYGRYGVGTEEKPDKGADASFGNAIYVAKPNRVVDAYTVALPHSAGPEHPPASDELLGQLARGPATDAQRDELGKVNEGVRDNAEREPRSALVARVAGPDGRERTIINVHLSQNKYPEDRERQLEYITKIVEAERSADPSREIVVLGDFNSSTAEIEKAFEDAGLHQEVGGQKASFGNYDQVWVSNNTYTSASAQVETDGASDHLYAGYTVLE